MPFLAVPKKGTYCSQKSLFRAGEKRLAELVVHMGSATGICPLTNRHVHDHRDELGCQLIGKVSRTGHIRMMDMEPTPHLQEMVVSIFRPLQRALLVPSLAKSQPFF